MAPRYVSITIIALILGLMLAVQFRTTNMEVELTAPRDRAHELTVELKNLAEERARLEAEAEDLERKLSRARQGYAQAKETLEGEVEKAALIAGLTPVTGSGARVLVATGTQTQGALFAVRDEDLLKLVNELRAAGAEALSINGERLISASEIRLAGSFINVNTRKITPPYEILAIGDPAVLVSSLEIKGGLVETLRDWGMMVTVESMDRVRIPAYKGTLRYQYARPVREPT